MLLNAQGVVRLATDVEIKYMNDGKPVANFSVVSSEKYKAQSGEQKENACFIQVTVWGRLSEICNQYLHKGSKIFISGKLKQDSWTDQQTQSKRSKHTITLDTMEMLDNKSDGGQAGGQGAPNAGYGQHAPQQPAPGQPAPNANTNNNVDDPNRHNAGGAHNRPSDQQERAYNQNNPPQPQRQFDVNGNPLPVYDQDGNEIPF